MNLSTEIPTIPMTLYECRVMQGYIIQVSDLVKAGCKPNKFHSTKFADGSGEAKLSR